MLRWPNFLLNSGTRLRLPAIPKTFFSSATSSSLETSEYPRQTNQAHPAARPLPSGQSLSDKPALRGDFGAIADPLGDAPGRSGGRYYAIAPPSSASATNVVAFSQPPLTGAATSANLLAYDTSKQLS